MNNIIILIITDNLPSQINGVVTTFKNIQTLAANEGFEFVYLDPSYFPHCSAPGYPDVKLSFPIGISSKIISLNPDYIHIATEGPIGLAARLWLGWKKIKYNTSYHTKFPELLKQIYNIPEWITYAYIRWFHKNSYKVLTTTETMVKDLQDHGFKGNILAWTRGVDRTLFTPRLELSTQQEKILLNVGRVSKEKGLDDFCQLKINNTRKIIVGDGPYKRELEKKYSDVEFVGSKTGADLAKYFHDADVFVFPSRKDTFGVVIIEALACGTPVAAYPVPGPMDIIDVGTTGHLSENLTESVQQCLTYNREEIVNSSRKWTWQRCWEIFKNNLIKSR